MLYENGLFWNRRRGTFRSSNIIQLTDVTARHLEADDNMSLAVVKQRPPESFLIQRPDRELIF